MRDSVMVKKRQLLHLCVYTCEVDYASIDLLLKEVYDTCSEECNFFSYKAA
jgi:hypothetical protein